jgi:hypothetical protein
MFVRINATNGQFRGILKRKSTKDTPVAESDIRSIQILKHLTPREIRHFRISTK